MEDTEGARLGERSVWRKRVFVEERPQATVVKVFGPEPPSVINIVDLVQVLGSIRRPRPIIVQVDSQVRADGKGHRGMRCRQSCNGPWKRLTANY